MSHSPADNPFSLVAFAAENFPEQLSYVPFLGLVQRRGSSPRVQLIKKRVLQKPPAAANDSGIVAPDGAPAREAKPVLVEKTYGRMVLEVPEAIARNLKGPEDQWDVFILFHVRRAVYEAMKSGILPATILSPH